jgi:hypothetical protein
MRLQYMGSYHGEMQWMASKEVAGVVYAGYGTTALEAISDLQEVMAM